MGWDFSLLTAAAPPLGSCIADADPAAPLPVPRRRRRRPHGPFTAWTRAWESGPPASNDVPGAARGAVLPPAISLSQPLTCSIRRCSSAGAKLHVLPFHERRINDV